MLAYSGNCGSVSAVTCGIRRVNDGGGGEVNVEIKGRKDNEGGN